MRGEMEGSRSTRTVAPEPAELIARARDMIPALAKRSLELRLQYKFQSSAVIERCTLLAARIFKATGAAGLSDELPFGRILTDLMAARQHISNQYDYYGSNWGAAMFGLESKVFLL